MSADDVRNIPEPACWFFRAQGPGVHALMQGGSGGMQVKTAQNDALFWEHLPAQYNILFAWQIRFVEAMRDMPKRAVRLAKA